MAIVVGNLLTDPSAQSFISVEDADAYLAPEMIDAWDDADTPEREAALVQASRWIAISFDWCRKDLSGADLEQVGRAAARFGAHHIGRSLWGGVDARGPLSMAKAGEVQVQWRGLDMDARRAINGKQWPWLEGMLHGLLCEPYVGIGVLVV